MWSLALSIEIAACEPNVLMSSKASRPKALRLLLSRLSTPTILSPATRGATISLRGASLALVSREYRDRACKVFRRSRFLELAARPDFQLKFAESMFF